MIVGALLDEQGVPICCEVLPGNTADLKTLIPKSQEINWEKESCIERDERIVGHIFCSFLALVLKKELIRLLDQNNHAFTWAQIVDDLNSLAYIDVTNDVIQFPHRSGTYP